MGCCVAARQPLQLLGQLSQVPLDLGVRIASKQPHLASASRFCEDHHVANRTMSLRPNLDCILFCAEPRRQVLTPMKQDDADPELIVGECLVECVTERMDFGRSDDVAVVDCQEVDVVRIFDPGSRTE
jgi:hypothetical protein